MPLPLDLPYTAEGRLPTPRLHLDREPLGPPGPLDGRGAYPLRITLNLTVAALPTLPALSVALIEILCFLPLPRFDFALTL